MRLSNREVYCWQAFYLKHKLQVFKQGLSEDERYGINTNVSWVIRIFVGPNNETLLSASCMVDIIGRRQPFDHALLSLFNCLILDKMLAIVWLQRLERRVQASWEAVRRVPDGKWVHFGPGTVRVCTLHFKAVFSLFRYNIKTVSSSDTPFNQTMKFSLSTLVALASLCGTLIECV